MDMSDKVLDVFKTLINELNEHNDKVCIPYEEVLNMKTLTLGECEYIDTFLENINTHSKKITNKAISTFCFIAIQVRSNSLAAPDKFIETPSGILFSIGSITKF